MQTKPCEYTILTGRSCDKNNLHTDCTGKLEKKNNVLWHKELKKNWKNIPWIINHNLYTFIIQIQGGNLWS